MRIEWHYITSGKLTQNALIESFSGTPRHETSNDTTFVSLADARTLQAN
jgi:transposase InsO family protein